MWSSWYATIKSYWDVMEADDARTVAMSFLATLVLGSAFVGGFIWLAYTVDAKKTEQRRIAEATSVERTLKARAARQGRAYVPGQAEGKGTTAPAGAAAPSKLPQPAQKRHIPLESQQDLIATARIQLSQDKADKALVTYLTLLYAAAESRDGSSLPANLTECLRGAAECYRKLGQPENAVKFLQAERRVFEEVVVSAANGGKPAAERKKGGGGILQSLLNPSAAAKDDESLPQRCQTLSDVAEACTRLGRHDVALAYRVKAAAVKQKVTGKPLDDKAPELATMAAALAKVKEMGIDTNRVLKEATSGENAVGEDDPIIQKVLQQQKDLLAMGKRAMAEAGVELPALPSAAIATAGPPSPQE